MNIAELHKKLLAAARANPPGDRVPYAFEKRVMALLAARAAIDPLAMWVRGLWRAAVSCAVIALLFSKDASNAVCTRAGTRSVHSESA